MKPNGYVLYEDPRRIVVATLSSDNVKTGDMIQTWILNRAEDPVRSVKTGADETVCGDCPLRGDGTGAGRGCYVNVGQAPLAVWRSYHAGKYPLWRGEQFAKGRKVRWGAYGDPTHIPATIVRGINRQSDGWTGYTHQWRNPALQGYKDALMASCETIEDARKARAAGWRTFRLGTPEEGEIECPSARGVQCKDCTLCRGASTTAKSITIPPHGTGRKYAAELVA
jgi:hypothetical protein